MIWPLSLQWKCKDRKQVSKWKIWSATKRKSTKLWSKRDAKSTIQQYKKHHATLNPITHRQKTNRPLLKEKEQKKAAHKLKYVRTNPRVGLVLPTPSLAALPACLYSICNCHCSLFPLQNFTASIQNLTNFILSPNKFPDTYSEIVHQISPTPH